jgi:hypothetical protein
LIFQLSVIIYDDRVDESEVESLELLMSDVRRDANGTVVYVGATMMTWLLDNSHLTVKVELNLKIIQLNCSFLFFLVLQ